VHYGVSGSLAVGTQYYLALSLPSFVPSHRSINASLGKAVCFRIRKQKGISKYMYKDARRRIE
jgi:hypothetical protein